MHAFRVVRHKAFAICCASSTLEVQVWVGTSKGDTHHGTAGTDMLFGLAGADKLDGKAGNDLICGGAGKDQLRGGPGADYFSGGPDKDTAPDFNASEGDIQDGTIP